MPAKNKRHKPIPLHPWSRSH